MNPEQIPHSNPNQNDIDVFLAKEDMEKTMANQNYTVNEEGDVLPTMEAKFPDDSTPLH